MGQPFEQGLAAAFAAAVVASAVYPLDLMKTDQQINIYQRRRGLQWFHGLGPKVFETVSKNFVFFFAFHWLGTFVGKQSTKETLVLTFLAGVVTSTLNLPFETVCSRVQAGEPSFWKAVRKIRATQGFSGFFKGLALSILLCSNPMIHTTIFMKIKSWILGQRIRFAPSIRHRLSSGETFFLGALAKCVATLITYPMIARKTCKQVGLPVTSAFGGVAAHLMKTIVSTGLIYALSDKMLLILRALVRISRARTLRGRPLAS